MDTAAHGGIVTVESNGAAAVGGVGSEDHALADVLALEHGTGCQIAHDAQLFADEILRLEPLGNAGEDAALALTVEDGQVEQLLALTKILSGIAKWFKPEDLIGKKIGIVCNLAPRPMMKGKYVSEGMIFAADTADGGCSIAFYGDDTPVGSRIH